MKALTTYLETIGLSKTESQLYLTGLKQPATVDELIDGSGIKRSTAYHALDTLQQKGLASAERRDGHLLFTMQNPESLSQYLTAQAKDIERQQVELDTLLPLFPAAKATKAGNYRVEHYESIEGLKKVVDAALDCKKPEWRIIAPRQNFFSEYDRAYAEYYLSKRKAHKIKAKTLWEGPVATPSGKQLTFQDIVTRNPRYLPKKYHGTFNSVIIIFDDKVAFISSLKSAESLLVQSTDLANTRGVMCDALWDASRGVLQ